MSAVPPHLIFVLGMGRSGTSALTGMLTRMGYAAGTSLMPAAPSNPKGFWENSRLMELHDQFLAAHGSNWNDLRVPLDAWWSDDAAVVFRNAAREVFAKQLQGHERIVIKDPRLNRILPLWFPLLDELGIGTSFVHIIRNPVEVAMSLARRDGFTHDRTYLGWMQHNLLAEYWARGQNRLFVEHQDLIAQPERVTETLRTFCGIETAVDLRAASNWIDPALHRERISDLSMFGGDCSFFGRVNSLWEVLSRRVDGEPSHSACDVLREWYGEVSGCLPKEFCLEDSAPTVPALPLVAPEPPVLSIQAVEELHSHLEHRVQFALRARKEAESENKQLRKDIKQMLRLTGQLREALTHLRGTKSWQAAGWLGQLGGGKGSAGNRLINGMVQKLSALELEVGSHVNRFENESAVYQTWLEKCRANAGDFARKAAATGRLPAQLCIGLVLELHPDLRPALVNETIASVMNQVFSGWRLLILRTGPCPPDEYDLPADDRITIIEAVKKSLPEGINFFACLDAESTLEPYSLAEIALLVGCQDAPLFDLVYSDEDEINEEGIFGNPLLKPEWSPETLESFNYVGGLAVYRREYLDRSGADLHWLLADRAYELALSVIGSTDSLVKRVPQVLYHRRKSGDEKRQARLQVEAETLRQVLSKRREQAQVSLDATLGVFHVRRAIARQEPVTILIPTRDKIHLLQRCVASLTTLTRYEPYEIVILNNDSREPDSLTYLRRCNHRVIDMPGAFNYAAMQNEAVRRTSNPWLLFLNNDTEVIEPGWLAAMAEQVQRPEIGAVGAKLLFPNGTVQHAGVVMGDFNYASHAFLGAMPHDPSGRGQLQITRNYSAVTAACMMMRREVYERIGGMDARRFPVAYNDVELCVRALKFGYRNVYTPHAVLKHQQSASRQPVDTAYEIQGLLETCVGPPPWSDPYYHPSLNFRRVDFTLSRDNPPVVRT